MLICARVHTALAPELPLLVEVLVLVVPLVVVAMPDDAPAVPVAFPDEADADPVAVAVLVPEDPAVPIEELATVPWVAPDVDEAALGDEKQPVDSTSPRAGHSNSEREFMVPSWQGPRVPHRQSVWQGEGPQTGCGRRRVRRPSASSVARISKGEPPF